MGDSCAEAVRAGVREWLGLAVLSLACVVYSMDLNVLFLAMPDISAALHPSPLATLWISDIYGFMLAGFLITMGTLGDRFGRRRVLLAGAIGFGLCSALAAFAPSTPVLIVARACQGIAGATIAPSTLSLVSILFRDDAERNRAIGIWGAAFAIGSLLGPIIGGILLSQFHWGSIFLVNIPIMVLLILCGPLLPEQRTVETRPLDIPTLLLSLSAVLPVVLGIKLLAIEGMTWGSGVAGPRCSPGSRRPPPLSADSTAWPTR